jgi:transposase
VERMRGWSFNRFGVESGVKKQPPTQLEVKTLLNPIQHFVGFVYHSICLRSASGSQRVEVRIQPHRGLRGKCATCQQACPGYDPLAERRWLFVPLWGIVGHFFYRPRRVDCPAHGSGVEHIPWSQGKRRVTTAMMGFLARWARRLSWRETARTFQTSWEALYPSVEWCVTWGLAHRRLEAVQALGLDAIHWGKGQGADRFLTGIYQIDRQCRRLLWVGPRRTQATLRQGLAALGPSVLGGRRFVASDMGKPSLTVIAAPVGHALPGLDRCHITMHLNPAVDPVRRGARTPVGTAPSAARLKKMRGTLLRRGSRVRDHARTKLNALLASQLATARAWMLKNFFAHFWTYKAFVWGGAFRDYWTQRALRSRLEPMKRVARMRRSHEALNLNWFKAKGEISTGPVEGRNNKVRVVTRRSYGFRTYKAMELALYHNLGRLPEPENSHSFC